MAIVHSRFQPTLVRFSAAAKELKYEGDAKGTTSAHLVCTSVDKQLTEVGKREIEPMINNNKKSKTSTTVTENQIEKNDDANKGEPRHLTVEELLSIVGGAVVLAHRC
jgi:hypothetical protein